MTEPVVSIIMPCYNYAHVLSDTLNSLLNQTYQSWECIIIDDGSTDGTAQVVEHYSKNDSRFVYIFQQNKGPNAARNNGLRNSKGVFIQFLDADDLLESRKIEVHVHYLIQHSEIDIVYSEARYFTSQQPDLRLYSIHTKPREDKPWMPKISGEGEQILLALLKRNIMVNSSPLLRRSIVDKVGWANEELWQVEDWHFWIMCALAGARFQYIDQADTLALIRFHACSNSSDRWKIFFSELVMRNKIHDQLPTTKLAELNNDTRKHLISFLEKLASHTVIYHNKKLGIQRFLELYKATRKKDLLLNILYARLFPARFFAKSVSIKGKILK
jgi:glycosyltransferase involved in cell wall biosynthesis